jgi:hypothetical protein
MTQCAVCGEGERKPDPLIPDEFYPGVSIHLYCLNSAAGHRWREERSAADPAYRRYNDMITVGRQVSCPSCGSAENWLSQKSSGFSPSFELCCTRCDRYSHGLSPYEHTVTGPLSSLQQDFVRGINLERIEPEVQRLSAEQSARQKPEPCSCGGAFVIAAKPRCHACREVLADTYFHYSDEKPQPRLRPQQA